MNRGSIYFQWACVRTLLMFQCSRSVMWMVCPGALLSRHYSPHLTAHRTCALDVLAPAPRGGCGWQRLLWDCFARHTLCTVFFCSATIPYCHTPRGQSFLCSLSGHQPHTAHRVCSSVSGSLGDISWYFHPPSPKGTPRSPCNPSHSCRFDRLLYNCNTSSGRYFCPMKIWNT